jgi:penicillin amidase
LTEVLAAYGRLETSDPERARRLSDLVEELRQWDQIGRCESVATTLFVRGVMRNAEDPLLGLERLRDTLTEAFGTWRVNWGEVNRLQRIHTSGVLEEFSDRKPSVPVAGAPSATGTIFTFGARAAAGQKRWYGTVGDTYIAVIEFGKRLRAQSLLVFGESADPKSPHYFDQAPLYSEQKFKPAWFELGEIRKHTENRYRP